ncbi:MAG: FtsW/RodA/SpoVE family cell cycle protein, partial [Candidatus Neomarinimicrobiota bacterium]
MVVKSLLKSLKGQPSLITWDVLLLVPAALLLLMGLTGLYSTSLPGPLVSSRFVRQVVWVVVTVILVWLLRWLHPRFYYSQAYRLYFALLILLLLTYLMPASSGGRRWIMLGPINLQPAELGKIVMVFILARYLTDYQKYLRKFPYAMVPFGMVLLPAIMIVGQPDLGTAIIYLAVTIPMMYWAGISSFHLFIVLAPAVSLIAGFNYYTFSIWMVVIVLVLYFTRTQPKWGVLIAAVNVLFGILAPRLWN